jgi:hypothetical protein
VKIQSSEQKWDHFRAGRLYWSSHPRSRLLGERLRAGVTRIEQDSGGLPADVGAESFVAVWVPADRHEPAEHWLVELAIPRTEVLRAGHLHGRARQLRLHFSSISCIMML